MGQWHSLIGCHPDSSQTESLEGIVSGKLHEIIYNTVEIQCQGGNKAIPFPMLLWNLLVRPNNEFSANPIRGRWCGWHVAIIGDYATDADTFVSFPRRSKKLSAVFSRCKPESISVTQRVPNGYVAANHSKKEMIKLVSGELSGKNRRRELLYPPSCLSVIGLAFLLAASGDGRGGGDADIYILIGDISPEEAMETIAKLTCVSDSPRHYSLGTINEKEWYLNRRLIGRWAGCCVEIVPEQEVLGYKDLTNVMDAIVAEEVGTPVLVNGRALFPDLELAPGQKGKREICVIDREGRGTLVNKKSPSLPLPVLRASYNGNLIGRPSRIHNLILDLDSDTFILQKAGRNTTA